jgi:ribosomal protein S18 acetylase RimI-like enzyme/predicted ester cyclase
MDLVTRYYEQMWNRWNFDLADELIADEFVFRGSLGRQVRGREEFKDYMRLVQTAFSDFHNQVEHIVACGSDIVARLEYTGTHDGKLLGIRPTFRRIRYAGIAMFQSGSDRLLSGFVVGDRLTLLEQILGDVFWAPHVAGDVGQPPNQEGIRRATSADLQWCADLMAQSEPWMTLRRDRDSSLRQLGDASKELYVLANGDDRLGFVLIDMRGALSGYIQSVCIAPQFQNRGYGTVLMRFAEERIFKDEPNVFLCVSSFNSDAQRFYERHNYERVGELPDFIVPGASEIILRKTMAPKTVFAMRGQRTPNAG